jgi:hypothetical protein
MLVVERGEMIGAVEELEQRAPEFGVGYELFVGERAAVVEVDAGTFAVLLAERYAVFVAEFEDECVAFFYPCRSFLYNDTP